jgi:hypothetical protein
MQPYLPNSMPISARGSFWTLRCPRTTALVSHDSEPGNPSSDPMYVWCDQSTVLTRLLPCWSIWWHVLVFGSKAPVLLYFFLHCLLQFKISEKHIDIVAWKTEMQNPLYCLSFSVAVPGLEVYVVISNLWWYMYFHYFYSICCLTYAYIQMVSQNLV